MENVRKAMIMASAAMAINTLSGPATAAENPAADAAANKGKKGKQAPKKRRKRVKRGKKRRPKAPDSGFGMPAGTMYDVIARSDIE